MSSIHGWMATATGRGRWPKERFQSATTAGWHSFAGNRASGAIERLRFAPPSSAILRLSACSSAMNACWTTRHGNFVKSVARFGLRTGGEQMPRIGNSNSFERLPPASKGNGRQARSAQPGGWRSNLTLEEQEAMLAIIGPMLAELGYLDAGERERASTVLAVERSSGWMSAARRSSKAANSPLRARAGAQLRQACAGRDETRQARRIPTREPRRPARADHDLGSGGLRRRL